MKTIFVSSTFVDMQQERDAIRDIVSPNINQEARLHGDSVDFCDLRWGINTEGMDDQAGSRKVLDVCLREIDRSQPPMIILLGDRYGWIPEVALIREITGRENWNIDSFGQSVTALEIEYGAFYHRRPVLIYIRELSGDIPQEYLPEDEEHHQRLVQLKRRLMSLAPNSVRTYSAHFEESGHDDCSLRIPEHEIYAFAEMVTNDLKSLLLKEWEEYDKKSPFDRSLDAQWAFIREKNQQFFARMPDAALLLDRVRNGEQIVAVTGTSGSGKSTLLSYVACQIQQQGWDVLPFISGLTADSSTARNILQYSVKYLQQLLDWSINDIEDTKELKEQFCTLANEYAKTGRKMLVVIDAVDQLFDDSDRQNGVYIPTDVSSSVQFLLTSLPDVELPAKRIHYLRSLTTKDRQLVVDSVLRWRRKEISDRVIEAVCNEINMQTPLSISLIVERLRMMDSSDFFLIRSQDGAPIEAITEHQLQLLHDCPTELEQLSVYIFDLAAQRINESLLSRVTKLLAVSRYGLRPEDLKGLCDEDWNRVDFAHLVNYLSENFQIRPDGRYDFMHKCIRDGLRKKKDACNLHSDIASYFETLDIFDPVRQKEYVYHLVESNKKREFLDYITSLIKTDDSRRYTARNDAAAALYYCILNNQLSWVVDLLKVVESKSDVLYVTWFLAFDLYRCFGSSRQELLAITSVYTASLNTVLRHKEKITSNNLFQLLSKHYSILRTNHIDCGNYEVATEYGEKHLSLLKEYLGENRTFKQDDLLFSSYYNLLCAYKAQTDELQLARAIAVAEEAKELLTPKYVEHLLNTSDILGQFYGCIGEIYQRQHNYNMVLKTYKTDLGYRKIRYERSQSDEALGSMCGGYLNVSMALRNFPTQDNLKEAWRLLDDSERLIAPVVKGGKASSFTQDLLGRCYENMAVLIMQNPALFPSYHGSTPLQLLLKAIEMFLIIARKDATQYMKSSIYSSLTVLVNISQLQYNEENLSAVKGFCKLIADMEDELYDQPVDHLKAMFEATCITFGTVLEHSDYKPWVDMAETYKSKAKNVKIRIVPDSKGQKKNTTFSKEDSTVPEKRHVEDIFRHFTRSKTIKPKNSCSYKQIENACKSYAIGLDDKEVIALVDSTFFGNGKKGMIFTENKLYASCLPKPILYADISNVHLRGDELTIVCKDQISYSLDTSGGPTDVYDALKEIVENL